VAPRHSPVVVFPELPGQNRRREKRDPLQSSPPAIRALHVFVLSAFALAQPLKPELLVVGPQFGIIRAGFEGLRTALSTEEIL